MSNIVRLVVLTLAAAVLAGCGETDAASHPLLRPIRVSQPARTLPPKPKALAEPAKMTLHMRSLLFEGDPEQAPLPTDVTEARATVRAELERAEGSGYGEYHAWRRARSIGIRPKVRDARKVLGVIAELGYPNGLLLVVGWTDGSASLYLGSGGGMIGGHHHETVRQAARALTKLAEGYVVHGRLRQALPLPRQGEIQFTLLTPEGPLGILTDIERLTNGENVLTPLYRASHDVITQFRLIDEKRRAEGKK